MTAQDKVFEVFRALGENVTYQDANKWIRKKYGDGVSDATFYNSRKVYRGRRGGNVAAQVVSEALPPTNNEPSGEQPSEPVAVTVTVGSDITLADLQKVRNFAKEIGGQARLFAVLTALEALQAG